MPIRPFLLFLLVAAAALLAVGARSALNRRDDPVATHLPAYVRRVAVADNLSVDALPGEFILPYDAVRAAAEPDTLLLDSFPRRTPPRPRREGGTARP